MRNIKLVIEYKGSNYCGWQVQKNGTSIQSVIVKAIEKATGENVALSASGRTDAGVHALGQVANFKTASNIPSERFAIAINSFLPEDISIVESVEIDADFHARKNAKGKIYRYYIWNSPRKLSVLSGAATRIPGELDVAEMSKAVKLFEGVHDFAAFKAQGGSTKTSVREIFGASVTEVAVPFEIEGGRLVCIELCGSGFLYNMVRIISGTLVELGQGKRSETDILEALHSGERELAGKTLPPDGLYLYKVLY